MRCEEVAGLSVAVKHCWFSRIKNHGHKEEMQWPTFYIRQAQQQTVRSHDGLRALLGHTAHAAKTGHCHSPILMVLACRSWLHTCMHTYVHTYIHTYMHAYIHTYHLFTHHLFLSHTIFHIRLCPTQLLLLHHLLCLSFPLRTATFVPHYWKKVTCGVIGSFNFTTHTSHNQSN